MALNFCCLFNENLYDLFGQGLPQVLVIFSFKDVTPEQREIPSNLKSK